MVPTTNRLHKAYFKLYIIHCGLAVINHSSPASCVNKRAKFYY